MSRDDGLISPTAKHLSRGVDIGLGAIIFASPLFMSGRHAVGEFVFVTLCTLTFVLWMCRQVAAREHHVRPTGGEWIWAAAIVIVGLQLIPLPASLLTKISPQLPQLLPLWAGESEGSVGLGTWSQVSLHPASTRSALVLLISFAMLFTLVTQRINKFSDAQRLLKWVACAAGGYSILALVQMVATEHNTLAVFDYAIFTRTVGARGAFPNPNHFGHFAALGVGPLLIWIHTAWNDAQKKQSRDAESTRGPKSDWLGRFVAPALLAITLLAAVLTFSRGAVISVAVATGVTASLCLWKRLADLRTLAVVGTCFAIACLGLGLHGYQRVSDELTTLTEGIDGLDHSHLRRTLWSANIRGARDFSMLGTGAGSHQEVYRTYIDRHLPLDMTHAENGYVQIFLENGLAGVIVLGLAILLGLFWVLRSLSGRRDRKPAWLCTAAAAAGLTSTLVHSVYDFIWSVPACVALTLVLLAVVCRVGRVGRRSSHSKSLPATPHAWLLATACAGCVAVLMIHQTVAPLRAFPHWQAYLDLSLRSNKFDASLSQQKENAVDPLAVRNTDRMLRHLRRVVELQPDFARAHARLAGLLERRFEINQADAENAMPLSQFRDAAFASQFSSKQEQEAWLSRAMGENRRDLDEALKHARLGLQQCPLQGEAYCHLANLAFLEGYGPNTSSALINQARRVRPRNSMVLMTAGIEAITVAKMDQAQELLKTVFNQEPGLQREIIQLFGYALAPTEFVQIFEPDYYGLKNLYAFYRTNRNALGLQTVGPIYAVELKRIAADQKSVHAANNLYYAHSVYYDIGQHEEALRCIQEASTRAPRDVKLRRALGNRLAEAGRYEEAVKELQWCQRRKPNDEALRSDLAAVNRLRLSPRQAREQSQSPNSPRGKSADNDVRR